MVHATAHLIKIFLFFQLFPTIDSLQSAENKLQQSLLENYNKNTRPVLNFTSIVNITMGSAFYQLVEFDVKAETMTTLLWQRITWNDEYLTWDPEMHSGIDVLRFAQDEIWVPDILPYNEVGKLDPVRYRLVIPLYVTYKGRVHWNTPITLTTTCTMDVTDFPFDSQTCTITVGSWQYPAELLDIHCFQPRLDTRAYSPHTQWSLERTSCERFEISTMHQTFSYITFTFEFSRLHTFYTRTLLLPNACLLALSSLIFFLPADQGERIGFGVTITLSLCVNLMIMADFVPETSKTIPKVSNYFLSNIFLSASSIAVATISTNIHKWTARKSRRCRRERSPSQELETNDARTEFLVESPRPGGGSEVNNNHRAQNGTSLDHILRNITKLRVYSEQEANESANKFHWMVKVDITMGLVYFVATTAYSLVFITKIYNF